MEVRERFLKSDDARLLKRKCLTNLATLDIHSNMSRKPSLTLGLYLKSAREEEGLTLRAVEAEVDISNAYLSQLEGDKIKRPSPTVLHELSKLYEVSYETLMELAGYPVPGASDTQHSLYSRIGRTTKDEEDALVDYLGFLRSRKGRRGR
jgi:transcriptional regulator with XRE-family HTH domain